MRLKPITVDYNDYPSLLHPYLTDAPLYDSSCSPDARVIFIDKGQGYFLKSAAAGSLKKEAEMTRYFHEKGFAAEVVTYSSDNFDWLLTTKVPGNNCIAAKYLEQPERLCDVMAETLARLHGSECSGCPVRNHTERYLHTAESNYRAGHYDISYFRTIGDIKHRKKPIGL